eukprot:7396089-Alexandrium_andersonii.AAC.1
MGVGMTCRCPPRCVSSSPRDFVPRGRHVWVSACLSVCMSARMRALARARARAHTCACASPCACV